jgi:hypothetical protein
MSKIFASAIFGAILLFPLCVHAQKTDTVPYDMRRWEASGSVDGLWRPRDRPGQDVWWDEYAGNWIAAFGGEIGHYWSSHVKGEVTVMLTPLLTSSDIVEFPPAVLPPRGASYYIDKTLRVATVSPRATYQFRENVFAHPYLSAGIRVLLLREHRIGDGIAYRGNEAFTVPTVDDRTASLRVRPFVAGGFKSYFNERVFVRTEIQAALGSTSGVTDMTSRISFGADF